MKVLITLILALTLLIGCDFLDESIIRSAKGVVFSMETNVPSEVFVNKEAKSVTLKLSPETNLDNLQISNISISAGATTDVQLDTPIHLPSSLEHSFTITSEDGTQHNWRIIIDITLSNDIKTIHFKEQLPNSIELDTIKREIRVTIKKESDISNVLLDSLEVSPNATASITSPAQLNLATPYSFDITNRAGEKKSWTIIASQEKWTENNIISLEVEHATDKAVIDTLTKTIFLTADPNKVSQLVIKKLQLSPHATTNKSAGNILSLANEQREEIIVIAENNDTARWSIYANAHRVTEFTVENQIGASFIDFQTKTIKVKLKESAEKNQLKINALKTTPKSSLSINSGDKINVTQDFIFTFTKPDGEQTDWTLQAKYVGNDLYSITFSDPIKTVLDKAKKEILVTLEGKTNTTLQVSSSEQSKGARLHPKSIDLSKSSTLNVISDYGETSEWTIKLISHITFNQQSSPTRYDALLRTITITRPSLPQSILIDTLYGIMKKGSSFLSKGSAIDVSSRRVPISILSGGEWVSWVLIVQEEIQLENSDFSQTHEETMSAFEAGISPLQKVTYLQVGASNTNSIGSPWISSNRAASLGGTSYLTLEVERKNNYRGGQAIQLHTKKVNILSEKKMSPGNIFTGNFEHDAKAIYKDRNNNEKLLTRYKPFNARPIAIKVALKYSPGKVFEELKNGNFEEVSEEIDRGGVGIMLEKENKRLASAYYMTNGTVHWINGKQTLQAGTTNKEGLTIVTIPIQYGNESYILATDKEYISDALVRPTSQYVTDFSLSPTHINITLSSSIRAGNIKAADGSLLTVDYIELIY